jgi:hypothetical protein
MLLRNAQQREVVQRKLSMKKQTGALKTGLLLGVYVLACVLAGCVPPPPPGAPGEPREGFYDHDHARWYHNHAWVDCGPADPHCH